jgi:hydrogenase maturation factor HypE
MDVHGDLAFAYVLAGRLHIGAGTFGLDVEQILAQQGQKKGIDIHTVDPDPGAGDGNIAITTLYFASAADRSVPAELIHRRFLRGWGMICRAYIDRTAG